MEEVAAYAIYQWDCPDCGGVNEENHDPQGETVECPYCKGCYKVHETR